LSVDVFQKVQVWTICLLLFSEFNLPLITLDI
jgi:hypothetical protein